MTQRVLVVSVDRDLIDLLQASMGIEIAGILDRNRQADAGGVPILGSDDDWPAVAERNPDLSVVLAVDTCMARKRLAAWYGLDGLITVIAPDSYISPSASVGKGTIIQRRTMVSAGVAVGHCCKLNINVAVHHDCRIGAFSTLAPGSQLLGNVTVGEATYIGAGAIVLPRVSIGAGVTVGAGAVVTRDVPDGTTVVGVPAHGKLMRSSDED